MFCWSKANRERCLYVSSVHADVTITRFWIWNYTFYLIFYFLLAIFFISESKHILWAHEEKKGQEKKGVVQLSNGH